MPYHTPDASTFTKKKKDETDSAGSLAISRVKRRAVNPYTFYRPAYRVNYEGVLPPPAATPTFVLITKSAYLSVVDSGNLTFYNGGNVAASSVNRFADGQYYLGRLFDGINSGIGFAFDAGVTPMSITLTFPVPVFVTKIFMVARNTITDFPASTTLTVDSVPSGTTTNSTISNALGLVSPTYNGVGIYIQPNKSGTVWKFNFPLYGGYTVLEELEMQGYAV